MQLIFTQHVSARIAKRHLFVEEVEDAIYRPDRIIKKHDKFYMQKRLNRGIIEVVCEKRENHIKVITVYWV